MIAFLTCADHGGVHRAITHGPIVEPKPICGATPDHELVVVDALPRIGRPAQVCQPCFPGFHDTYAAEIWAADA